MNCVETEWFIEIPLLYNSSVRHLGIFLSHKLQYVHRTNPSYSIILINTYRFQHK